ncbi:protein of unknown function [Rhodovastum atsumiense]|nr:protein of unknown function [Rhodovastum atsumiense]
MPLPRNATGRALEFAATPRIHAGLWLSSTVVCVIPPWQPLHYNGYITF